MLHEKEEKSSADRLVRFIKRKKYKVTVSSCTVTPDRPDSLGDGFFDASHIMAILSESSARSPWFSFVAGFSLGSGRALLGYPAVSGELRLPPSYQVILISNDNDLDAYLAVETEEWAQKEAYRRAKAALLDMGIPFNEESLENCIREQKYQAVSHFIDAGFSPNARDKFGVPLLNLAARAGDLHIVKLLLKAGASVNLQAEDRGTTALIDSTAGKYLAIMELLLEAGAEVNLKSKDGQSALIIAVGLNDEASTELLLKAGANADEPDSLGASARKYALLFNKPAMVELFKTYAGQ
ncbi:ankyrin repeat domain-containing protein [Treponema sp. TIM-1]|uniref:ankyrin repeat domain-containing protein n=1 Tax=Treponema sp. TIM-1 TaxID=2898417 RepID=UPI00397EEFE7